MPLILARPRDGGTMDVIIVLGPDNIERMKERDPVEFEWFRAPFKNCAPRVIGIAYASDAEMTQIEQLVRQGKTQEAINMVASGWTYHPEKGDHDMGPQRLR